MKRAVISLPNDPATAHVIAGSLLPETRRGIPRTAVNVREDEGRISLEIQAEDTNALRAAVNSYLRWISVSRETYLETRKC